MQTVLITLAIFVSLISFPTLAASKKNSSELCAEALGTLNGYREVKVASSVASLMKETGPDDFLTLTIHLKNNHLQADLLARRVDVVGVPFSKSDFDEIVFNLKRLNPNTEVSPSYLKRMGIGLITVTAKIENFRGILDVLHDPALPLPGDIQIWPPQTFAGPGPTLR